MKPAESPEGMETLQSSILSDPRRGDLIHYEGLEGLKICVCGRRPDTVLYWFSHTGRSNDQGIKTEPLSSFQEIAKGIEKFGLKDAQRNTNVAGFISEDAAKRWENGENPF